MSEMKGTATIQVSAPNRYDEQTVVPAKDRAFEAEPSVVIKGFPVVPELWAHTDTITSATGGLVTSREEPTETYIECHSRFTAGGFDDVGGTWPAFLTHGVNYFWVAPPGLSPSTERVEYRIGKEMLERTGLRFFPGDYLNSSFNSGIDDALAFTVVLAMTPRIPTDYTVFSTTDDETELSLSIRNGFVVRYGDQEMVFAQRNLLNMTPVYVVISVSSSIITVWLGSSTRRLVSRSMRVDTDVSRMKFMLGKAHQGKANASMSIYEFLVYSGGFNATQAYQAVADLSYSYGSIS